MLKSLPIFLALFLSGLCAGAQDYLSDEAVAKRKALQEAHLHEIMKRRLGTHALRYAPIKITGQVVDAWSYLVNGVAVPEKSPPYQKACRSGAVLLAIVESGTGHVFIAAKAAEPYQGCQKLLPPHLGKTIKLEGYLASQGGSNILRIEKMKPVPQSAPAPPSR